MDKLNATDLPLDLEGRVLLGPGTWEGTLSYGQTVLRAFNQGFSPSILSELAPSDAADIERAQHMAVPRS